MVKTTKSGKGSEKMQETTMAMDVVEDASTELPEIPLEMENLSNLIDQTLTELSNNVNILKNIELKIWKLRLKQRQ